MNFGKKIKKGLKLLFSKRPNYLIANIVTIGSNELLLGKVALITGGTSGIGFSIAKAFIKSGADICITGRNELKLENACKELNKEAIIRGVRIFGLVLDNRDISSFDSKLHEILQKMGKIDILVNNAGVQGAVFGSASEEQYDEVLDTNLKGTFFLSQVVARYMVNNGVQGNILNIASASSLRPASDAYVLSKVAIKELTMGMAKTLIKYGIVVNGLAPGPTVTPMLKKDSKGDIAHSVNPLGRYALPEEIANMAVVLCSGMGRTIVGSIIYMTGGAGTITYDDIPYTF